MSDETEIEISEEELGKFFDEADGEINKICDRIAGMILKKLEEKVKNIVRVPGENLRNG